jgi:hypothetical protein
VRIFALALLCALVAGCGGAGSSSPPPAVSTTNPHMPVPPMALTVFRVAGGALRPSVVHVPRTQAVATAALNALGVDATVQISGGTATVDLNHATDAQVAEIVYTLTQFGSVQRVDVAGRTGLTRDDLAAYEPPILIESPAANAMVPGTFTITGSASVFEATLVVEVVRDGEVLEKKSVTASAGAPDRGTFATALHATAGDATVKAFAPSAEDGSPQHEVDVPVTISP